MAEKVKTNTNQQVSTTDRQSVSLSSLPNKLCLLYETGLCIPSARNPPRLFLPVAQLDFVDGTQHAAISGWQYRLLQPMKPLTEDRELA